MSVLTNFTQQGNSDPLQSAIRRAEVSEGARDAAGSTQTAVTVEVGDRFSGRIGSAGDTDWIRVELEAGQTYVFTAFGTGGSASGIDDTVLQVRGSGGESLRVNDDIDTDGRNFFSALTYTAETTGTHYIEVAAYGSETGTYTVQTATNVYTPEQVASQLTELNWGFPSPLRFDLSNGRTITYNVDNLTADGQRLARLALESWSLTTGINFVAVGAGSAQIVFDDNQAGAFAGPSAFNPNTGFISRATVNVSTQWLATYGTEIDSYSFATYVHEIGHALGLGHSGNYDGSATYPRDALYLNDSYQMTIMSYFSVADNTFVNGVNGSVVTPMVADGVAMEFLYGPSTALAGNTVWGANSNVPGYLGQLFGIVFDDETAPRGFYSGEELLFTIHDSGGTDTIDLSTVGAGSRIDLRPGMFSDIGSGAGNDFAISPNTTIENAIGTNFADEITGNTAGNVMEGRGGNDTLRGGAGRDYLYGGTGADSLVGDAGADWLAPGLGNDVIFGGADLDTLAYNTAAQGMVIDVGAGRATGPGGEVDTFSGVEHVVGTQFVDTITGDSGANRLRGLNGRDTFVATTGADTYEGGNGADRVTYDLATGPVTVNLTTGRGSGGMADGHRYISIERVTGSAFDDTLTGSAVRDFLTGGDGDDFIFATASNDQFYGGSGVDTVSYSAATSAVTLSLTQKLGTEGMAAGHGYTSIENVIGGRFDDRIQGSSVDNRLEGGAGNDTLRGNGGDDVLIGGSGTDALFGDDGDDLFFGGTGDDRFFGGTGRDEAQFSGARSDYTITAVSSSAVQVSHIGGTQADGVDTLYSIEALVFTDQTVFL